MKLFESQSSRVRTEVLRIQIFKLNYAHWILVFNLGEYRRQATEAYKSHDFFRPDNTEAMAIRSKVAMDALQDVCDWIESGGEVAVRCRPLFFSVHKTWLSGDAVRCRPSQINSNSSIIGWMDAL